MRDEKNLSVRAGGSGSSSLTRMAWILFFVILMFGGFASFWFFKKSAAAGVVIIIFSLAVALSIFPVSLIFFHHQQTCFGTLCRKDLFKLAFCCVLFSSFVEVGTLIGSNTKTPFEVADWSVKRLFILTVVVYLLFVLCLEYFPADFFNRFKPAAHRFRFGSFSALARWGGAFISLEFLFTGIVHCGFNISLFSSVVFGLFLAIVILVLFKAFRLRTINPETAFVIIALSAGLSFISVMPASNLLSWDDEVHYGSSLRLSFISDPEFTSSDLMMMSLFRIEAGHTVDASLGKWPLNYEKKWTLESIHELNEELDEGYLRGPVEVGKGVDLSILNYNMIGYIPSAIGLWIGRLFKLPFHYTFALGRVFNLISYCAVTYLSILIIPRKKLLLFALALIPTSLFMACSYSYDPWLISFGFLAVSLVVREFYIDRPITFKNLFPVFLAFFLSLGPKAVYFPFIGLLFLMPSHKIPESKKVFYYSSVCILGFLVVLTFVAPLVATNGGGAGDPRGGADVNATLQLKTLLSDPAKYARLLCSFIFGTYLVPSNFSTALLNLAYLGDLSIVLPNFAYIFIGYLFILMLWDDVGALRGGLSIRSKLWVLFLFAIALFGICTALYLSFTPVGANTISGVQSRYLLPFLYPMGVFVLNTGRSLHVNSKVAMPIVFLISSLFLLITWWILFFSRLIS